MNWRRQVEANLERICLFTTFPSGTEADGGLLGLPETENELDNLTEFNTAQNRRISMMGIPKEETFIKKRRKIHITFNEEEDVINPWDVDPSIGRFTNLVQSTVIPKASKQQSQVECFHDHYLHISISLTCN